MQDDYAPYRYSKGMVVCMHIAKCPFLPKDIRFKAQTNIIISPLEVNGFGCPRLHHRTHGLLLTFDKLKTAVGNTTTALHNNKTKAVDTISLQVVAFQNQYTQNKKSRAVTHHFPNQKMKTGTMYSGSTNSKRTRRAVSPPLAFFALLSLWSSVGVDGFTQQPVAKIRRILQRIARSTTSATTTTTSSRRLSFTTASCHEDSHNQKNGRTLIDAFREIPFWKHATNVASGIAVGGFISSMVLFSGPVWAENELSDKYGGGLDTSLVDQTCLVDKCSLQAKACLKDDPSCRKGLTCTAKCLGDNACITGCMARYGNQNLDRLLKCTIEDHECIKVAILPGGSDKYGQEPRAPGPTVQNFDPRSLEGSWYKVVGYNPNYDCYACQRNSFKAASSSNPFVPVLMNGNNKLDMEVEFSMPRLLPDGSPPPPSNNRELIRFNEDNGEVRGIQSSIALNDYYTRETMVFDRGAPNPLTNLKWTNKQGEVTSYARTAHSEGEMFGLSKLLSCSMCLVAPMEN